MTKNKSIFFAPWKSLRPATATALTAATDLTSATVTANELDAVDIGSMFRDVGRKLELCMWAEGASADETFHVELYAARPCPVANRAKNVDMKRIATLTCTTGSMPISADPSTGLPPESAGFWVDTITVALDSLDGADGQISIAGDTDDNIAVAQLDITGWRLFQAVVYRLEADGDKIDAADTVGIAISMYG